MGNKKRRNKKSKKQKKATMEKNLGRNAIALAAIQKVSAAGHHGSHEKRNKTRKNKNDNEIRCGEEG